MSGHTNPQTPPRSAFVSRYGDRLTGIRTPTQSFADAACWVVGLTLTQFVRFDFSLPTSGQFSVAGLLGLAAVAAAMQVMVGLALGLYRNRWRYGSIDEIGTLVVSVAAVTALMTLIVGLGGGWGAPVSVVVGAGVASLLPMVAVRYLWRMVTDQRLRPDRATATPVVVVGAGEAATQLVTSMLRNPASRLFPVAFVDDDPTKQGLRIKSIAVEGTSGDLGVVARRHHAKQVVVAIPSANPRQLRAVADRAAAAGLPVQILPPMDAMLRTTQSPVTHPGATNTSLSTNGPAGTGIVSVNMIRPVTEQDLLGRAPAVTDLDAIAGYLSGRRVLVTGAGGSIGSELCRQVHSFAPAELIMLDRDESALHALQLSIDGRGMLTDGSLVVADIRDRQRIMDVFSERRPHVVFHAAALKHVSLLEQHPHEGAKTNVTGTQNVLDAAQLTGVERFVNISTDKAANPTSVLGYTKRIAERLTSAACDQPDRAYLSVRFGNVLGSRGSMLGAFRSQIESGGPVLVTDPEVSRFFMTIEEAVQLLISAGAIGKNGEVMVLDMGEPVRIIDVAHRLIAEAETNGVPAGSLDIEFTGLRPGEKLHEELFDPAEVPSPTDHELVRKVAVPALSFPEVVGAMAIRDNEHLVLSLARLATGATGSKQTQRDLSTVATN